MEYLARTVAENIVKFTAGEVNRGLGYIVMYERNIENLMGEHQKLEYRRGEAEIFMNEAARKFIVDPRVRQWYDDATKLNEEVSQFLEIQIGVNPMLTNFIGRYGSLKSRYSLSKKTVKITQKVIEKLQEASAFGHLVDVQPPNMGSIFNVERIKDFDSRQSLVTEILEALQDDRLSIIGICGMPGVGKTTIAEKIVSIVESQKMFDLVACATVSQGPCFDIIQSDIVSCLGWEFNCDITETQRALKMRQKLLYYNKRILFVLDDVWKVLDLQAIGLPSLGEIGGCKIILTSCYIDVCNSMGSQKNFHIKVLSNEESWDLFRANAFSGNDMDNLELHQLGRQISDECGGLPIAIVIVAMTLKDRTEVFWREALRKLNKADPGGIPEMREYVCDEIELRYNLLKSDDARFFLWLCCLFGNNYNVPIESLVWYFMGLWSLQPVHNLQEARNRAQVLINELKGSFFLLGGDENGCVKVHILVRNVILWINSKKHVHLVCEDENRCAWWLKGNQYEELQSMSIFCEEIREHHVHVEFPKLELLQLCCEESSQILPDDFFKGMKMLKVLSLSGISALPPSPCALLELRTLIFDSKVVSSGNLEIIKDLDNLEILSIRSDSLLELPKKIGFLRNLRLLDLSRASGLKYLPSGVLSTLLKLEELYVSHSLSGWEPPVFGSDDDDRRSTAEGKDDDGKRINAILRKQLRIYICEPKPSILPEHIAIATLRGFNNLVGNLADSSSEHSMTELSVEGNGRSDTADLLICLMHALIRKTENLTLASMGNLNSISSQVRNDGLPQLRTISIRECNDLADITFIQFPGFNNLRKIKIERCSSLKVLFPFSIARRLNQLQSICIEECNAMEGVFPVNQVDDEEMTNAGGGLPPKVKLESEGMEQPSTSGIQNQVAMTSVLIPFSNLQELILVACGFKMAFQPSVAKQLQQLKSLKVSHCDRMKYIVGSGGKQEQRSVLPKLTSICFCSLKEFVAFSADSDHVFLDFRLLEEIEITGCPEIKASILFGAIKEDIISTRGRGKHQKRDMTRTQSVVDHEILFNILPEWKVYLNVKFLRIANCGNLRNIFSSSQVAQLMVKLERMQISECKNVEEIVAKEYEEARQLQFHKIAFPQLREMELSRLQNVKSFYSGTYAILEFESLEILKFDRCNQMKTFSSGSSSIRTPRLEEVHVNKSKFSSIEGLNAILKKETGKTLYIHNIKDEERIAAEDLSEYTALDISSCQKLSNAIPHDLIASHQMLRRITVQACNSLQKVFECEGDQSNVKFPQLEVITLRILPKLEHIFTKIPKTIDAFQKLSRLHVYGCHSLRNVFSVSVAKVLLQLQVLKLQFCLLLEEIIAREDKEEEEASTIIYRIEFPQLKNIDIIRCSNFQYFYSGKYALKFPSLESLHLPDSGRIGTFSIGPVSTGPKLLKVNIGRVEHPISEGLNATVKDLLTKQRERAGDSSINIEDVDDRFL